MKSADFFDAANHQNLTFKSTKIEKKGDSEYKVTGDLTIRGVTKPIELKAEFGGISKDFGSNDVAGWEITGKINRQEYGLKWSAVTEAGGIVVSDEVRLVMNVEAIKEK